VCEKDAGSRAGGAPGARAAKKDGIWELEPFF
jgi:hypothetical protein